MCNKKSLNLPRRMRRLRSTAAIRNLVRETVVRPDELIQPLFVKEDDGPSEPIETMPGQLRYNLVDFVEECKELHRLGISGIAPFPQVNNSHKTPEGLECLREDTIMLRAIREVKKAVPDLLIFADLALDPYTSHGHDGPLNEAGNDVLNDETVDILCQMAVASAKAGADFVAPSDMMDGRIGAIRSALDEAGYKNVGIFAYSVKFDSAYYGPFRDAVGSKHSNGASTISKATYQADPRSPRQAILDCLLDEDEGADMLMVKPAALYLDIIYRLKEQTFLPIGAYQISGEYSQIKAAEKLGWLDYRRIRDESIIAIKRAGADLILTYFAKELAEEESQSPVLDLDEEVEGI